MFTSYDKAIVAAVGAILYLLDLWWGFGASDMITEEWVGTLIAIVTPLLVWIIPNRGS